MESVKAGADPMCRAAGRISFGGLGRDVVRGVWRRTGSMLGAEGIRLSCWTE